MNEYITIELGGEEREIKMTFGLLDALAGAVGEINNLGAISVDSTIRNAVLKAILVKRNPRGVPQGEADLYDLDMKTALELLDWAGIHIADFFLKGVKQSKTLLDSRKSEMVSLTST